MTTPKPTLKNHRIQSLDILRGLVMVVMALDHCRDFTNHGYLFKDPTDLLTTTPLLFFTRWITHFCAPVFVFLAGTSSFLYGTRKSKSQTSKFLLTRGLWLIFIELTIINLGWTFNLAYEMHILQVIWVIGISMVILSGLIYLPTKVLLPLGLILVAGHNMLDGISKDGNDLSSFFWYLLHQRNLMPFTDTHFINIVYPLIPWLGLMILGFTFGHIYKKDVNPELRKKWLLGLGFGSIILFFTLRLSNLYGDPVPWAQQNSLSFTLISFFNLEKYPPSFGYLLMTIGPSLVLLHYVESIRNKLTEILIIIGRVPFFFYIIHIYVIHIFGMIGLTILGENWKELIYTPARIKGGYLLDKGFDIWVTYAVWALVIIILYPLCKKYQAYKAAHPEKWWLSYL